MNTLRQIGVVTLLNFRTLSTRFWTSLVIVTGMATVVGVLLSMLCLTAGYVHSLEFAGDPGKAIILSAGAEFESRSAIPRDAIGVILDAPGIRKNPDGSPVADAETLTTMPAHRKTQDVRSSLQVRGFGRRGLELRPGLKVVSGRLFRPGAREMIVGRAAQTLFANLNPGDKVIMPDGEWRIVGVFATADNLESELIADNDTLMSAIRRAAYNSVTARLDTPGALAILKNALTTNPTLAVSAQRHSDYYQHLSERFSGVFNVIAYAVGVIMAVGALFGTLNTMYAAVSARSPEIATLRALGFGGVAVATSVLAEALLLALAGALIGAAIAWAMFNGQQRAFGSDIFNLAITPGLVGLGIGWALIVALLGGLLPSIRAARLTIVEALRVT